MTDDLQVVVDGEEGRHDQTLVLVGTVVVKVIWPLIVQVQEEAVDREAVTRETFVPEVLVQDRCGCSSINQNTSRGIIYLA